MSGVESTEDRQAIYDENARMLAEMVSVSDKHAAEYPNCPANPLCISGVQAAVIDHLTRNHPDLASVLIIVAVLELSRDRKQHSAMTQRMTALTQRLELQREMTAGAGKRIEELEDEVQILLARLDADEHTDRVIEP